jgi:hypothetical protein
LVLNPFANVIATVLFVAFARDGEEPETHQVIDGQRAAATAITVIASRLNLQPGDTVVCR